MCVTGSVSQFHNTHCGISQHCQFHHHHHHHHHQQQQQQHCQADCHYASATAGGIMFLGCSCVCPYVFTSVRASQTLLTQCLEKCWTYFHQTFRIGAFCFKDESKVLGSKGQSSRSRWAPICSKIHFLALLMRYI